jgi:hypothetical protein
VVKLTVPREYRSASVHLQRNTPVLYLGVTPSNPPSTLEVHAVETGGAAPPNGFYLGTALLMGGDYVLHYFSAELK